MLEAITLKTKGSNYEIWSMVKDVAKTAHGHGGITSGK